jgi:hypothetical protein
VYSCPICSAVVDDRARHLDWHAALWPSTTRRRRTRLSPLAAGQAVNVTVTWASAMPTTAYAVTAVIDAPLIGRMAVAVTARTATGCQVRVTPAYDLTDAVLDVTAYTPAEETP